MQVIKIKNNIKILFTYRFLPQYKVDFFQQLRKKLAESSIDLQLVYGKRKTIESLRNDEVDIEWAKYVQNKSLRLGKIEFIWQPILKYLKGIDLLIIQPESKLILTYYAAFAKAFLKYKVAFWGHGRNMHSNINSFQNKFQRLFIKKCDHWFTYTSGGKKYLLENKFPENRITVTNNAIDTISLKNYYCDINEYELTRLKRELRFNSSRIGIYCGGMYPNKRLNFIIEVCHRVKKEIPDFEMIFIGSGIDSKIVKKASNNYEWIYYVGPKFGIDRVKYFKISSIQIMPYLVGLSILDSFALETPIITTNNPFHGPEIEYLEHGINGIITNDNIFEYSRTIIEVLKTKKYHNLIEGCKLSAEKYTVENMVESFKNGILSVINNRKK